MQNEHYKKQANDDNVNRINWEQDTTTYILIIGFNHEVRITSQENL